MEELVPRFRNRNSTVENTSPLQDGENRSLSFVLVSNDTSEYSLPRYNRSSEANISDPTRHLIQPFWYQDIRIPFYIIILFLAVVGNVLVIITLGQNKRMRTVTNVFLLNLSISDLLLAIFCMPFTLIPVLLKNFIFGETICVMIRYLQGVSVSVSCFTLVAISLERYFAICRPLHSRTWQTLSHAYMAIAVCWTVAAVVMLPVAVYTKLFPLRFGGHRCKEVWDDVNAMKAYTVVLDLVLLLCPIFVMSLSYGMIIRTLWKGLKLEAQMEKESRNGAAREDETEMIVHSTARSKTNATSRSMTVKSKEKFEYSRGIRQFNSEKYRAAKLRVIRMLFVIVLEFFVCWTPLYVLQTWKLFDYPTARRHFSPVFLSFIHLLSYVSSCCNPITYCFMNKKFRQGFLSAFRCCRRANRQRARRGDLSVSGFTASTRTATSRVLTYDRMQTAADGPDGRKAR